MLTQKFPFLALLNYHIGPRNFIVLRRQAFGCAYSMGSSQAHSPCLQPRPQLVRGVAPKPPSFTFTLKYPSVSNISGMCLNSDPASLQLISPLFLLHKISCLLYLVRCHSIHAHNHSYHKISIALYCAFHTFHL